MNKDLTTGKPEKVLWQFCLPLFGSIIFQQLYNIADSFVAGKFISDNALAAVGNSYEITLIFIAFAFGCNIACSVLAALFFGAKQYNDLKTTVYTALISSCVICAVLMLVGTLCCDSLLRLIKTPEEVFADSKLYLDIYIYGLPFVFLYNVATGISQRWATPKRRLSFLPARPRLISRSIFCLLRRSTWALPVLPGRRFCARESAACWRLWSSSAALRKSRRKEK